MKIDKSLFGSLRDKKLCNLNKELAEDYQLLFYQILMPLDGMRDDKRIFLLVINLSSIKKNGFILDNSQVKFARIIKQSFHFNCLSLDNSLNIIHQTNLQCTCSNIQGLSTDASNCYVLFHERNDQTSHSFNVYYEGVSIVSTSIFDNPSLYHSYTKRYSMDQIDQLFDEYQKSLDRKEISLFFFQTTREKKESNKKIKNLLRSAPEYLFQRSLKEFIHRESCMQVGKEGELIDKTRYDILLEDSSRFALIEIKWMGKSCGDPNTKGVYTYKIDKVEDGLEQIFRYLSMGIKILDKKDGCGYLIVFDARIEKEDESKAIENKINDLIINKDYEHINTNFFSGCRMFNVDE